MITNFEWETPQDIFDHLDREFNFTLDPCSTDENAKCDRHFTIKENGLTQDWSKDRVFMNPPYGREIKKWVKKAYQESLKGSVVVCLIAARTDASYWHDFIFGKAEIRFIKGRVKFTLRADTEPRPAPFPSAIVIFPQKRIKLLQLIKRYRHG